MAIFGNMRKILLHLDKIWEIYKEEDDWILHWSRQTKQVIGTLEVACVPSSETQEQIVGVRRSLNGWKNMARRKLKNGEKCPWGQCLTRPVPNGHSRSDCWLVRENLCVFLPNPKPEWRWPFGTGLVRHCPQGLFSPFFTFLRAIFFRPFRLSFAPTICPWVSEDACVQTSRFFLRERGCLYTD